MTNTTTGTTRAALPQQGRDALNGAGPPARIAGRRRQTQRAYGQLRRILCAAWTLLLLATLHAPLTVAAADDPATIVQRFLDARNRGDVATAAGLLIDDVVFVGGPNCPLTTPCIGIASAREQVRQFYADGGQATIAGTLQVAGTTVRGRLDVRSDASRSLGIDRYLVDLTMELRDDKLTSHRAIPDATDPQTARYLASLRAQQGQASVAIVARLLAALNAGDLDAAMLLVADAATIRYQPAEFGPSNGCCTGKASIRLAYGNLIAGKSPFASLQPLQGAGETVTGRIRQTGAGVRAAGLAAIDADNTFTIRGGLIVAQVVAFTPETIDAGFRGVGAPPPPGLPNTGGGWAGGRGQGEALLLLGLGLASAATLASLRARGRRADRGPERRRRPIPPATTRP